MFLSKAFSGVQLRWSIPDKEAFAIFHTLKEWEYLLRDRKFVLQTDHKNLTYLRAEISAKVKRWRQYISEFDFTIGFIPGADNIVADSLSRCCDVPIEDIAPMEIYSTPIPSERAATIAKFHNEVIGHNGVEMTMKRMRHRGITWDNQRGHVEQYIRSCPCCQKMSQIRIPIQTHPFTVGKYNPMETINIDSIGELPEDIYGNKYILVMIDCFTRWVEIFPIPDLTALTAARCLLAYVGRFGVPSQIKSDGGTQFVNGIITEFTNLLNSLHTVSLAYSKEENSLVERSNKEVMRHLRAICFHKNLKNDWSKYLPFVQRIMNASPNASIGVSASQLLYGNMINLDRQILPMTETSGTDYESLSEYAQELITQQNSALKVARETQYEKDQKNLQTRGKDPPTTYAVGELVLLDYSKTTMGRKPPTKLHTQLRGPLKVTAVNGDKYEVEDLATHKIEECHVTAMRPFLYDSTVTNPVMVAYTDNELYEIERVLAYKGDKNGPRSQIFLHIHWTGYDNPKDYTWERIDSPRLLHVDKVHQFLIENKMKRLVPQQFR